MSKILVTGAGGFLGAHIMKQLGERGEAARRDYDLRDKYACWALLMTSQAKTVIHCAARVGGIGANAARPGEFFYDNLTMGINVIDQARCAGVEKVVIVGTCCSYPKFTETPFREVDLWNGYPEDTNAAYGVAKKALLTMGQAYRQQYGLNVLHLLPANLFGPGDHFGEGAHVIPDMIRKFSDAVKTGAESVTLWGDGSPTREFLYVEDAAKAIVLAAERYDGAEPVNIGSGIEIQILDLAIAVADFCGFQGDIKWDGSKPNGQPRRRLDTSRAAAFGFTASTDFETGLKATVAYYSSIA